MLERLPGVRHAFSTREGGVSRGASASLNLGFAVGDDPRAVEENRRRFAREAGFAGPEALVTVSQVHGPRVVWASSDDAPLRSDVEADAVLTSHPGLAVAVGTADCAPVLLVARDGPTPVAVAAVHAGWRGACAGVVAAAVRALEARGARPEATTAAVGPTIGPDAFEVGEEVVIAAAGALSAGAPKTREGPRGRPLLDLPDLVRQLLVEAGLSADAIDVLGACTHSDPRRFFSHRRDRGRTGRHLSAVSLTP
jgi:hypothetical protein